MLVGIFVLKILYTNQLHKNLDVILIIDQCEMIIQAFTNKGPMV